MDHPDPADIKLWNRYVEAGPVKQSFPANMFNKTTIRKDQPGICTYIKRAGLSSCGTMPYLRNDSRCICDLLWRKSMGALIRITLYAFTAIKMKAIFSNILCSMISGMVCILTHYIGLGHHVEMIKIGNIMLLIPGVLMTNSFRDFISGDMISGLLHFSEAIITAICIAAGFIFSKILLGGIL